MKSIHQLDGICYVLLFQHYAKKLALRDKQVKQKNTNLKFYFLAGIAGDC